MDRSRSETIDIRAERDRSLRFLQGFLALMGLLSVVAGFCVLHYQDDWELPYDSGLGIAIAFLCVGIASTVLLFVWERIFKGVAFD